MFDKVQAILHSRFLTGEKPQHHVHFLKSMLACARCGGRFGITTPTNRHGTDYEYFYCLNRQKRSTCEQRYVAVGRSNSRWRRSGRRCTSRAWTLMPCGLT